MYVPIAEFVHPYEGDDTLGPLGEITSEVAQHVTRSRGWNIMVRVK
jgi:hypothetical protein